MKGTVKAYSPIVKAGIISGEDGKFYLFYDMEWSGQSMPVTNQYVKFTGQSGRTTKVSDAE